MLHLHAALAERERKVISERTIAALAAAKARGQALGNPKLAEARAIANANHTAGADAFADSVAPAIREAQAAGAKTLRQIAAALNGRGIGTARGGKWEADDGGERASADRVMPAKQRSLDWQRKALDCGDRVLVKSGRRVACFFFLRCGCRPMRGRFAIAGKRKKAPSLWRIRGQNGTLKFIRTIQLAIWLQI